MPFSYDTWGGSWGSSWGDSWGVAEVPDEGPQRIARGGVNVFSRFRWETTRLGQQALEEDKLFLEMLPDILARVL